MHDTERELYARDARTCTHATSKAWCCDKQLRLKHHWPIIHEAGRRYFLSVWPIICRPKKFGTFAVERNSSRVWMLQLLRPKTFYPGSPAPPSRCQPDHPAASRRCGRTRIRRPIRRTTDGSRFRPKSQNSIHCSRCAKFDDMTSRRKTCPRRHPISKMDCRNGESSTFPSRSPRSRGRCTLCATACRRFCILRNE